MIRCAVAAAMGAPCGYAFCNRRTELFQCSVALFAPACVAPMIWFAVFAAEFAALCKCGFKLSCAIVAVFVALFAAFCRLGFKFSWALVAAFATELAALCKCGFKFLCAAFAAFATPSTALFKCGVKCSCAV